MYCVQVFHFSPSKLNPSPSCLLQTDRKADRKAAFVWIRSGPPYSQMSPVLRCALYTSTHDTVLYSDYYSRCRCCCCLYTVFALLQAELRNTFRTTGMNAHLTNLEKILMDNDGGDGYFVGDKVMLSRCQTCLFVVRSR